MYIHNRSARWNILSNTNECATLNQQIFVNLFLTYEDEEDEVDEEDDVASTILSTSGMFRNFRTIFIVSLDSNG